MYKPEFMYVCNLSNIKMAFMHLKETFLVSLTQSLRFLKWIEIQHLSVLLFVIEQI